VVSKTTAMSYGFTGVMLRSTGTFFDIRKCNPYEVYDRLTFACPVGSNGDCYDRYLLRIFEMYESLNIMKQCLGLLDYGPVSSEDSKLVMLSSMEGVIQHFKKYSAGTELSTDLAYGAVEAPKGEFGVFLVTTGGGKPYRCKIRSPGFFHLQSLNHLSVGHFLADVVTIIGSLDVVFGEIDR